MAAQGDGAQGLRVPVRLLDLMYGTVPQGKVGRESGLTELPCLVNLRPEVALKAQFRS